MWVQRFELLGLRDLEGSVHLGEGGEHHWPIVPPVWDGPQQVVVGGLELGGFLVFVALEEEEARLWHGEHLLPNAALAHDER
jgi:hypothetical protein